MPGMLAQVIINGAPIHPLVIAAVVLGAAFGWVWVIGKAIAAMRAETPPQAPVPVAPVVQSGSVADDEERRRLIAVIAAAATVALGRRVAVRRITFINQNTVSGWAEAGRLSIQASHNIRR